MAFTETFRRIEAFRKATGRDPRTGVKISRKTKFPRPDGSPIDLRLVALALRIAANGCSRDDLADEYRRTAKVVEQFDELERACPRECFFDGAGI